MKSLEIFSGAGGLAKGLELAGFEHEKFVEFNKHACASLSANFDSSRVYCGDIKDFDLHTIEDIDIVAGGPPCQPFSMGGKHRANNDSRDMFPYAIRAIEKLTPKAFIFENVKGLLRPTFSEYFDYILLRLTYPGFKAAVDMEWQDHLSQLRRVNKIAYAGTKYEVKYKLVNAADYGVPQTRERVVIVGVRTDIGTSWSFPRQTHSEERLLWDMYVTGEYWTRHNLPQLDRSDLDPVRQLKIQNLERRFGLFEPEFLPWQTVRDAIGFLPPPSSSHRIADHIPRDGARSYPGHTGSDYDWPAKTIKAGAHGVPGGENMIRYEDGNVRYFTVHEAKLIQTFPAEFIVKGAWGEAMRQIGNAVPVRLAEILGSRLSEVLGSYSEQASGKIRAGMSS